MNRFIEHYKKTISYDLLTKFNYLNIQQIPKIINVNLNLSSIDIVQNKKKIVIFLLVLKLITNQTGKLALSKKNKLFLKVKKNNVVGCKTFMTKICLYNFLENLILFIFPNIKNFKGIFFSSKNIKVLTFKIKNILDFYELQNEFNIVRNLPKLLINLKINSNSKEESSLLLNSFNFPLKIS